MEEAASAVAREDGKLLSFEVGATLIASEKTRRTGRVGVDKEVLPFICATGLKYPLKHHSRRLDLHPPINWAAL